MKNTILSSVVFLAIITSSTLGVLAQDYKALKTDASYYFYDSVVNDLIAIKIDSVVMSGNDILYFNFPQIRPTDNSFCHISDGASWLGDPVIEKPGGIFLFKTINAQDGIQTDTLVIKTQSILNEEWKFANFPFSDDHIDAQLTAIGNMTFLGLVDSVKIITLTRKNAAGMVVPNDINGEEIRLSKNHGLIRLPKFDAFNDYIRFYDITGKTNPETGNINPDLGTIFDFEVGDEIHTRFYSDAFSFSSSTQIWKIKRITGKITSPSNDWKVYHYDICFLKTIKTAPEWLPLNETGHLSVSDTIFLNSDFAVELAKQPNQTFMDPLSSFMLSTSAFLKFQRPAKYLNYNYPFSASYPEDSCWSMVMVDGGCDPYYIKGLGGPYYDCPGNIFWYTYIDEIVYYKKGSETWGTPLDCDSLQHVDTKEYNSKEAINFYPNPTTGTITVVIPYGIELPCNIEITDIAGLKSVSFHINQPKQSFDLGNLPAGLYTYKLTSAKGDTFRGKIIRQ